MTQELFVHKVHCYCRHNRYISESKDSHGGQNMHWTDLIVYVLAMRICKRKTFNTSNRHASHT